MPNKESCFCKCFKKNPKLELTPTNSILPIHANENEFLHSILSDKDDKSNTQSIIKFNPSNRTLPMLTLSAIPTVKSNQIVPSNPGYTDCEKAPCDANLGDDSMVKPIIDEEDPHSEALSPTPADTFMSENKKSHISIIKKSTVKMVHPRIKSFSRNDTDSQQRNHLSTNGPSRSSSVNNPICNSGLKNSETVDQTSQCYVNNISNINVTFNTVAGPHEQLKKTAPGKTKKSPNDENKKRKNRKGQIKSSRVSNSQVSGGSERFMNSEVCRKCSKNDPTS